MRQMSKNVLHKLACRQTFLADAIWRSASSRWRMLCIRNRDALNRYNVSPVSRTTGPLTALYCCLGSNFVLFHGSVSPTSLASGSEISIELNVRGCFVIQLSTCSLLSRAKAFIFYHISFCLSSTFLFYFLFLFFRNKKLFCFSQKQLLYSIIFSWFVKHFFHSLLCFSQKSKREYGEGGIWTLAPRERSTPLAGAPLQPLEYFSICLNIIKYSIRCAKSHSAILY